MKRIKRFFEKPLALLALSALLAALPLTFPSLFLLSWVAFVPFFLVILRSACNGKLLNAMGRGVFFGFLYHVFVYYWFLWLYPLDFAGLDRLTSAGVVLLAWLGISLLHGALFAIPTLLCHLAGKKTQNRPFLLLTAILGIVLAEWIPTLSQLAFPWVRLSLGHYKAPALIQFASVFGIYGVDFLLLAFAALLTLALLCEKKRRTALVLSAALLFASNLVFGVIRLSDPDEGEAITVSAVQGCVLSGEKWSGQGALEAYVDLTLEAPSCDLILWPESAVPVNLATYPDLLAEYRALSGELDTPILMGCFWKLDGQTSNSAVLLDSDSVSDVYSKRHLVPFGEKMPYRALLSRILPVLEEINMLSSDLAEGDRSAIIQGEKGSYGSIICFESLFPSLTRQSVKDGAEMIVLVTNDSWYEDSPGVWQHLAHAVFRSVENSRSTARCANSGVSAFIDSRGRLKSVLGPLEKGVLTDSVAFSRETTVYTVLGDVLLPCLVALWLVSAGLLILWERRKKNERQR